MISKSVARSVEVQRLQAAAIDGWATNVRFRQNELQKLHRSLRDRVDALCSAIVKDAQYTSVESEAEYYQTMVALKSFYDSLNFALSVKNEHLIATGADHAERRVPIGLIVIRPSIHTRFYSIITPLAAAIAAGNCVLLELQDTLRATDSLLKTILEKALDHDTFSISSTCIDDQEILDFALLVDLDKQAQMVRPSSPEPSLSVQRRTIAVVDRTANIEEAAQSIVAARFSFHGTSPYSPDLVIVNDFVKVAFLEACKRHAGQSFAALNYAKSASDGAIEETRTAIETSEAAGQLRIFRLDQFAVVDVIDKYEAHNSQGKLAQSHRKCAVANMKIRGRVLPVLSATSLSDAVFCQNSSGHLLAAYIYAEPGAAKFLTQHMDAHINCINQIPMHLLIGPAAPELHPPSIHQARYTPDMFSQPRPVYTLLPPEPLRKVTEVLVGLDKVHSSRAAQKLRNEAIKPLPPTKQGNGFAIGFFEQGFLLGAGLFLVAVLPAVAYGT